MALGKIGSICCRPICLIDYIECSSAQLTAKNMKKKLTVAICSYNRAERLPKLVQALRKLSCPIPFEILIVDNNSTDATQKVVNQLIQLKEGAPVRCVLEGNQGIAFARNRAIEESLAGDFLLFIDDDELPSSQMLEAAVYSLDTEKAVCVGGKITINFGIFSRPNWLIDDLLPFYGEIDYGKNAFWIADSSTPIWSGIVAYQTNLFANNSDLRFDTRYNRKGKGIGGGEDGILFQELLKRKVKIRYQPDMAVDHFVEAWKIKRSYFIKLHFIAGRKYGQFQMDSYDRAILGVPPFMFRQLLWQIGQTLNLFFFRKPGTLRQAMNASHALGSIWGKFLARNERKSAESCH